MIWFFNSILFAARVLPPPPSLTGMHHSRGTGAHLPLLGADASLRAFDQLPASRRLPLRRHVRPTQGRREGWTASIHSLFSKSRNVRPPRPLPKTPWVLGPPPNTRSPHALTLKPQSQTSARKKGIKGVPGYFYKKLDDEIPDTLSGGRGDKKRTSAS